MSAERNDLFTVIIPTAVTTAFAAIGWIVNHILSEYRDRRNQQLAASLKYTERQLEELYGPLAFLVWEGRQTMKDLILVLERMRQQKVVSIFPLANESEWKLWLFWLENDLLPRNDKIQQLLMSKTHLLEGATMPESYVRFLNYHNCWKINYLRWKKEEIYEYLENLKIEFPVAFEEDIIAIFKFLKNRHANFLREQVQMNLKG